MCLFQGMIKVGPMQQYDQNGMPIELAPEDEEEEEEDMETLLSRLPADTYGLRQCISASQGCLLLLVLKQHLKLAYGMSDA